MKAWKKWFAAIAVMMAASFALMACNPTPPPPASPFSPGEQKVVDLVDTVIDGVLNDLFGEDFDLSELPKSVRGAIDAAGSNVVDALRAAQISAAEIEEILDLLESAAALTPPEWSNPVPRPEYVDWNDYWNEETQQFNDTAYEAAMAAYEIAYAAWRTVDKEAWEAYNAAMVAFQQEVLDTVAAGLSNGISDVKFATLVFELIKANKSVLDAIAADEELGIDLTEERALYNAVIADKDSFITAVAAAMKIGRVESALQGALVSVEGMDFPSKTEFKDLIIAYKADAIAILNELGDAEITALTSLGKLAAPLLYNINYGDGDPAYRTQQIERIRAFYGKVKTDYAKSKVSALAVLNTVSDSLVNSFYDAVMAQNASDIDGGAIIFGKILYAGVAASGGTDTAAVKGIVKAFCDAFNDRWDAEDQMWMDEQIEAVIDGLTALNGLSIGGTIPSNLLEENDFVYGLYSMVENINRSAVYYHRSQTVTLAQIKNDYTAAGYTVTALTGANLTAQSATATGGFIAEIGVRDSGGYWAEVIILEFANAAAAEAFSWGNYGDVLGKFTMDYSWQFDDNNYPAENIQPWTIFAYGYAA